MPDNGKVRMAGWKILPLIDPAPLKQFATRTPVRSGNFNKETISNEGKTILIKRPFLMKGRQF